MKNWGKCLGMLLCAALLFGAGGSTVQAEETAAPISAEQLLQMVNHQSAVVGNAHEILTENVRMTDTASGKTVETKVVVNTTANRHVNHTVINSNMTASTGLNRSAVNESWAVIQDNVRTTYTRNGAVWTPSYEQLSETQLAQLAYQFAPAGVSVSGSTVTTDGSTYKLTGVVNAVNMKEFISVLTEAGIQTSAAAFPVTIVVDTKTLLPLSMTVEMTDLKVIGYPHIVASAVAVTTYSEYGQHGALALPAEVIGNAA